MTAEQRMMGILNATPAQLAAIDAALAGRADAPANLRLLRIGEAARALGTSRQTIWRAVRENRLPSVELRPGLKRIPEHALCRMVQAGPHPLG